MIPVAELKNACLELNTRLIEELLRAGARVNGRDGKGLTVLMHTCRAQMYSASAVRVVETLIRWGADVNMRSYCYWYTPLMYAAKSAEINDHRLVVIEKLIDARADVNAVDCYGYSVMQRIARDYAKDPGYAYMVRLLLKAGAELDAADRHGRTPLMLACGRSSAGGLLFLEQGADPSCEDREGRTALSIAKGRGYRDVIEAIRRRTPGPQNNERRTTASNRTVDPNSQPIALVPGDAVVDLDKEAIAGNPYLSTQLISYLGNKRYLLPFINEALGDIKKSLGKDSFVMSDLFSGSGCVARLMKYHSSKLYANDLEAYSRTLNLCYLANRSGIDIALLEEWLNLLNDVGRDTGPFGFIRRNYSPKDDTIIQPGERAFYTSKNARIIDEARGRIKEAPASVRPYLLASLLVEASVHTNTSGTFRGFHKKNGVGHFGGSKSDDLQRIAADIYLEMPVFCERECPVEVLQMDAAQAAKAINAVDVAYLDPPYNQHPYGSNYFLLNIINNYDNPAIQDGVVGITRDWNRSDYNSPRYAHGALRELLEICRTLLGVKEPDPATSETWQESLVRITGVDVTRCPLCPRGR